MFIVTAVDVNTGPALDLVMLNGLARGVLSDNEDPNEARDYAKAQRQIDTWVVFNEGDVDRVVDFMSNNFIGRDISVFQLKSVSVRAPGELKTKSVSSDGILPG